MEQANKKKEVSGLFGLPKKGNDWPQNCGERKVSLAKKRVCRLFGYPKKEQPTKKVNGKFRWVKKISTVSAPLKRGQNIFDFFDTLKKSNRKNDLKNIKGINTRWSIFKGLEWQIQSRISGVFTKFFSKNRVFRSFSIKEFFPKKLYKKIALRKFSPRCDFSTGRPTEKSDHPDGKKGKSI